MSEPDLTQTVDLRDGMVINPMNLRAEHLGWKVEVSNEAEGRRIYGTLTRVAHELVRTPHTQLLRTRLALGSDFIVNVSGGDQVRAWSPGAEPDPALMFD